MTTHPEGERVEITSELEEVGITDEWLENLLQHALSCEANGYAEIRLPVDDCRALVERIQKDALRIRELETMMSDAALNAQGGR